MSNEKINEIFAENVQGEGEANAVVENPRYKNAIMSYKALLFESFIQSKDGEADKRESIYRQSKCIRQVEANLNELVRSGKLAVESLKLNNEEI